MSSIMLEDKIDPCIAQTDVVGLALTPKWFTPSASADQSEVIAGEGGAPYNSLMQGPAQWELFSKDIPMKLGGSADSVKRAFGSWRVFLPSLTQRGCELSPRTWFRKRIVHLHVLELSLRALKM